MLSDRAGLRVVLAIKRIPMKAASRFHQIPCPRSSITGALKRSCNFVFVNSPTLMDDSWQKFMNPMNDDAVGPAAPPHFAHLLTHSLHPSHSILGVALDGWRNRHPNVHPSFPSTSPLPTQPCPALPCPALSYPTHPRLLPQEHGHHSVRRRAGKTESEREREEGAQPPCSPSACNEGGRERERREERPRDFRAGIIMQQRCSGGREGR